MTDTLVVAGLSARLMAESARRDGFDVIALDVFGDADTRAAARAWHGVGAGGAARLDGERVLQVLQSLRAPPGQGRLVGWVPGAGFESLPDVLEAGARVLPLVGTAPQAQARLRTPGDFFAQLQRLGLPHPATRLQPPSEPQGWLAKDLGSSGGWHIHRLPAPASLRHRPYWQRESQGQPMSALFVADGRSWRTLGHQQQLVGPVGSRPFVWRGCIGPVPVGAAVSAAVEAALAGLVPAFGITGLASLDYLAGGDASGAIELLEVNPRPSASMALHEPSSGSGLMAAHVQASLQRRLPPAPPGGRPLRGTEIVFARHACCLDEDGLRRLQRAGDVHDLPDLAGAAGGRVAFASGDPVCSIALATEPGDGATALRERLAARVRQARTLLIETETLQ